MPTRCQLIADARERHILRHPDELSQITFTTKQITIGDYAIVDPLGKIMAIFERKSLEDAEASFKDGRWDNRSKMLKLREQTGCRIIFIIEGLRRDNYTYPEETCGRYLPYKHLESSLFHMMIRDNISVLWTKDTIDTAKTLARFTQSMDSLLLRHELDLTDTTDDKKEVDVGMDAVPTDPIALLTQSVKASDKEIVREMWSCFRGISTVTADEFIAKYSLADIIVRKADLTKFTHANGRKITKTILSSVKNIDKSVQVRLLAKVPGISLSTAAEIIDATPLDRLLTYDTGSISIIKVGKSKKNLGETRADAIKKYFSWRYAVAAPPAPLHDITLDELANIIGDM